MTSPDLDRLVGEGGLSREPGDQKEFEGLVSSGHAWLRDARNASLSRESTFELAYVAAHALSLAALRWHGYRSDNRYMVFQALPHTLGLPAAVWRVLAKCHGLRNRTDYRGLFQVDAQLLGDFLAAAERVSAAIQKLGPVPGSK